jgi:hypothetical protein
MATKFSPFRVPGVFLVAAALSGFLWAKTPDSSTGKEDVSNGPESIRQEEPHFYVRADVDHISHSYREGDSLAVTVTSERDGFAYVLYKQADGEVFQIFPNSGQLDNRVKAGATVTIPSAENKALFRWRIGPPFGTELIKVIVSKAPLAGLSDPALRQKWFNPVAGKDLSAAKQTLGDVKPSAWAEHQVEISTYARNAETQPSGTHRYGAFFGVSNYEFNAEAKEASEGRWEANRSANASGAATMCKVLRELGNLSDVRTYTNQQATRVQMEETITRWLPSVSRPGDTVFIYFCTHGSRITGLKEDPNRGDRYTYYFLPHEYADAAILSVLTKQREAGTLASDREARFGAWIGAIQSAGAQSGADIDRTMVLQTCITDDLMGRWLQALDGRQIAVIFETCHSGGFGRQGAEKAIATADANAEPFQFQFLFQQVSRLKDLGQSNATVLAACAADQASYSYRASDADLDKWSRTQKSIDASQLKDPMPVMTYQLVDTLLRSSAPLSLEAGCRQCREGMRRYFEKANDGRRKSNKEPLTPHEPHLFDVSGKPVYLKP